MDYYITGQKVKGMVNILKISIIYIQYFIDIFFIFYRYISDIYRYFIINFSSCVLKVHLRYFDEIATIFFFLTDFLFNQLLIDKIVSI